jgi:BlaI family penicillinase repressor
VCTGRDRLSKIGRSRYFSACGGVDIWYYQCAVKRGGVADSERTFLLPCRIRQCTVHLRFDDVSGGGEGVLMAIQRLTNAEISLMELLWETNPLTARQIRERLYDDSEKSQHGTVQRLLQSLEEKGFVSRDRSLGVQLFSPTLSREAYGGRQLESLAEKLTGGSIAPLLTHLLETDKLDKAEIRRLRKVLEEAQKRG